MANNYETSTILQTIPDRLLNDLDHRVLREMGATIEKTHDGSHYLCMEDYSVDFWFIEPERLPEIIGLFQDCYPEPEKAPKWVERLLEEVRRIQKIDELHPGDPQTLEIDFNEVGVDWHDVLQSLLEKPENTGPDRLDAIEIKAAYWCEKPRPA
ncbi:hypothetical protein TK90_2684 (plasmid) [Thioalkalivibrio sp. K90mix]|uniref:hypothetical protein n=1 Tax=Thioalkalivibrio sp. (strain K90mix) TaxID=396595 RepID=UPI0001C65CB9|nr:hypothetical protein [Thioalkalivibrio sp. K90mix]ADC73171.1 hypothetical protein TK90_2684 [Thioalkalivibrio sp. K90mix]